MGIWQCSKPKIKVLKLLKGVALCRIINISNADSVSVVTVIYRGMSLGKSHKILPAIIACCSWIKQTRKRKKQINLQEK